MSADLFVCKNQKGEQLYSDYKQKKPEAMPSHRRPAFSPGILLHVISPGASVRILFFLEHPVLS
jgi:hypothetical protein